MGAVGVKQEPKTRTQRLVDRIVREIDDWIEDSYIDKDEMETIENWHDLLVHLSMESSEAKEYIKEALDSDVWDAINHHRDASEAIELQFDEDGEFEDENGNFLKYKDVMKLVKQELVKKGYMQKAY